MTRLYLVRVAEINALHYLHFIADPKFADEKNGRKNEKNVDVFFFFFF
jgi:hypothetical protein